MTLQHRAVRVPAADVAFRPLTAAEAVSVPQLWNAAWAPAGPNPYPLTEGLWRERLSSRQHDPSLLLGAFTRGELIAVAYGKTPHSSWQPDGVGWVSLLATDPRWCGRG